MPYKINNIAIPPEGLPHYIAPSSDKTSLASPLLNNITDVITEYNLRYVRMYDFRFTKLITLQLLGAVLQTAGLEIRPYTLPNFFPSLTFPLSKF